MQIKDNFYYSDFMKFYILDWSPKTFWGYKEGYLKEIKIQKGQDGEFIVHIFEDMLGNTFSALRICDIVTTREEAEKECLRRNS